jgi:toxin ParE1/3/4
VSTVRWSRRAVQDLVELADYIARDDAASARSWVERLRERATLAAAAPRMGRRVPELGGDDVRETYLRTYRLVYRVDGKGIVVLTVVEGRRRLPRVDPDAQGTD